METDTFHTCDGSAGESCQRTSDPCGPTCSSPDGRMRNQRGRFASVPIGRDTCCNPGCSIGFGRAMGAVRMACGSLHSPPSARILRV